MCGILGLIDFTKQYSKSKFLKNLDLIKHRGPDSTGFETFSHNNYNVFLGHQRLSIIDVSNNGKQPMLYKDNSIIYNGEIYNFEDLKFNLKDKDFFSTSDTEILLRSISETGIIDTLKASNGMFAFGVYNDTEYKLTLARDRFGVKPLYIIHNKDFIAFSSELKALKEFIYGGLNYDAVYDYFTLGYVPQSKSIFENVIKLQPATVLEFNLIDNSFEKQIYWNSNQDNLSDRISISNPKKELKNLLIDSVDKRLISDRKVGVFLSGGIDSSLVTSIISKEINQNLEAFTIGFDHSHKDESFAAKEIADFLNIKHHIFHLNSKKAIDYLNLMNDVFDEPFADTSSCAYLFLSEQTAKHVTVSLSADGGDEFFGGYYKYEYTLKTLNYWNSFPDIVKKYFLKNKHIIKNIPYVGPKSTNFLSLKFNDNNINNLINIFREINDFYKKSDFAFLNQEYVNDNKFKNNFLFHNYDSDLWALTINDINMYMPSDILNKVDMCSMNFSLEAREPLLDYRLFEFSHSLSESHKLKKNSNGSYDKKVILKNILADYIPNKYINRPKQGFSIPLNEWMFNDFKEIVHSVCDSKNLNSIGIFNNLEVSRMINEFYSGNLKHGTYIYRIMNFILWHKKWVS